MGDPVECHSGASYAERPVAVWWEDQRMVITAVLSEWRNPLGKGFRVQTEAGAIFELLYNESQDAWQVQRT